MTDRRFVSTVTGLGLAPFLRLLTKATLLVAAVGCFGSAGVALWAGVLGVAIAGLVPVFRLAYLAVGWWRETDRVFVAIVSLLGMVIVVGVILAYAR